MVRSDELRNWRRRSKNYRRKEGLLCDRDPDLAYVRGVVERRAEPRRDWSGRKLAGAAAGSSYRDHPNACLKEPNQEERVVIIRAVVLEAYGQRPLWKSA
ncbi:hypothetical protein NDU88_001877 [Pleurodeles waltl]|uniref:Uncharacterized protein n=1 Tax=Pleurodeles waltl TaxID=8319 RepID=A0AAV7P830_PLEWA|nr:hypothetical protein NDU88_001877 [Pleurodeles waltl]